jgi:ATP-dependent helicase/nuclease subunit A
MSTALRSLVIRASAGSGKTYQLANRYLALLALQAMDQRLDPARLVALTFTRKAAGEFAQRILHGLARAAHTEPEAQRLVQELTSLVKGEPNPAKPGLAPGFELRLARPQLQDALGAMVDAFDRLGLGTIDSFLMRAAQTLGFELGMQDIEIMEPALADRTRHEVLSQVFEDASRQDLNAFYQHLKSATIGAPSDLRQKLRGFVDVFHKLVLILPAESAWGAEGFWQSTPGPVSTVPWQKLAADLSGRIAGLNFGHKSFTNSLVGCLGWLAERTPGLAGNEPKSWLKSDGVLTRAWTNWPDGDWHCEYSNKTCVVPAHLMAELREALAGWLSAECAALSAKTKSIYRLLQLYEMVYHRRVRESGRLVFDDLPLILQNGYHDDPNARAELLSKLAYRWHVQFDHWLIDEFQDTSRSQWQVLQPWLDEVLQDNAGLKTVLVVGDPKQSIYGWRGGEPQLFDEFIRTYAPACDQFVMNESRRSAQAVLDLVNRVCNPRTNTVLGDPEVFSPAALARWQFEDHKSMLEAKDQPGHAVILELTEESESAHSAEESSPENGAASAEAAEPMARHAQVIKEVLESALASNPNLSCAILVRKNAHAQAIAQWLRAHGVAKVMVEGDANLAEQSPVVAAILDAFRWLTLPAHTLGLGHVQCTPLWKILVEPIAAIAAIQTADDVGAQSAHAVAWAYWRQQIAQEGTAAVAREWCRKLDSIATDEYSCYCLQQIEELAYRLGSTVDLDEWLHALEHLTVRETSGAGAIHLMTIHKAKGLGFDLVILPDLDRSGAHPNQPLIKSDRNGQPMGCLVPPPKWLCSWIPELEELRQQQRANDDYEALSVLYVALTRARKSVFVILDVKSARSSITRQIIKGGLPAGADSASTTSSTVRTAKTSESNSPAGTAQTATQIISPFEHSIVRLELGFPEPVKLSPSVDTNPSQEVEPPLRLTPPLARLNRKRPSALVAATSHTNNQRVHPKMDGAAFGRAVHQVFAQIGWWIPRTNLTGPGDAVRLVEDCLSVPDIQALFHRDNHADECFVELPFEFDEGQTRWSGIIDRLILRRQNDGTLLQALLVDFKTDPCDDPALCQEHYRDQIAVYHRAAAVALDLPSHLVIPILVLTHTKTISKLPTTNY